MGGAYPDLVKQHELVRSVVGREEERFRQTLARGRRPARRRARRAATSPATTRSSCTTRSASRSTSPARSPRSAAATVDVEGFRRAHGRSSARAPRRRTRPRAARATARRSSCTASSLDEHGPTEFTGRQEYETDGRQGARAGRRPASGWRRPTPAPRSTSCSTARRSTPSPAVRSATPARSTTCDRRAACACSTRSTRCRASSLHRGVVEEGTVAEGDEVVGRDRRPAPRRASAATTPRPTSCTGRCARCSART